METFLLHPQPLQRLQVFQSITRNAKADNSFSIHFYTQFIHLLRQMRTVITRTMEITTVSVFVSKRPPPPPQRQEQKKKIRPQSRNNKPLVVLHSPNLETTPCPWMGKFGFCPIVSKNGNCPFTNHVSFLENQRRKDARKMKK